MPAPRATCPNCGAPVEFRWSGAVQTVCPHCRSVLVRRDLDLSKVGEVAELPADPSPIQIGTTGRFEDDAFTVTGRIVYEYDAGTWNEWHLAFQDGTSGWLSDALLDYSVYRQVAKPVDIPADTTLTVGPALRPPRCVFRCDDAHACALPRRRRRAAVRVLGQGRRPVRRPRDGGRPACDHRLQRVAAVSVSRPLRRFRRPAAEEPEAGAGRPRGEDVRVQLPEVRRGDRAARGAVHEDGRVHELRRHPGSVGSQRARAADVRQARADHPEDSAGLARPASWSRRRRHRFPAPQHRRRWRDLQLG